MSNTRRQHYISQFYLKNFADIETSRYLYVLDKQTVRNFNTSRMNVAQERDFHRVEIDGVAPNAVEDALAIFEGKVATSLREIRRRRIVSRDEHGQTLIHYMALALVKNPRTRSIIDDLTNKILSEAGKREASNVEPFREKHGDTEETERLRHALLAGDYTISLRNEGHLDTEFSVAPPMAARLLERNWAFVTSTEGQFVTCDRPVVLMRDDPGLLGIANREVQVLFTLSPTEAIIGAYDIKEAVINASRLDVAGLNAKAAWNANRQIYARDETFEYLGSDGTIRPGPAILEDPNFVTLVATDEV